MYLTLQVRTAGLFKIAWPHSQLTCGILGMSLNVLTLAGLWKSFYFILKFWVL